jgi:hypothetical protein
VTFCFEVFEHNACICAPSVRQRRICRNGVFEMMEM